MAVFVVHGFMGLNLTFRCLLLQYLHLEMLFLDVGFYISVFVHLLLPFRYVLSRFYNCSLGNNSDSSIFDSDLSASDQNCL